MRGKRRVAGLIAPGIVAAAGILSIATSHAPPPGESRVLVGAGRLVLQSGVSEVDAVIQVALEGEFAEIVSRYPEADATVLSVEPVEAADGMAGEVDPAICPDVWAGGLVLFDPNGVTELSTDAGAAPLMVEASMPMVCDAGRCLVDIPLRIRRASCGECQVPLLVQTTVTWARDLERVTALTTGTLDLAATTTDVLSGCD